MDMQIHPTMHLRYKFFNDGLTWIDSNESPKLNSKHMFKNVCYADYFYKNKGTRIFNVGLIGYDTKTTKEKAIANIEQQLAYMTNFVTEHDTAFAIATTPQEVRQLVTSTNKTIFLLSIEGAYKLIDTKKDVEYWSKKGISFITLIHLKDCEYGGSGIKPGIAPAIINFKGWVKRIFRPKKRGLTQHGLNSIQWIYESGMLIDLTHMSKHSRTDALKYMEENNIPPFVSHDMYKPIQHHKRSINRDEILKIYELGGLVSLPVSGEALSPKRPTKEMKQIIKSFPDYKKKTIDNYEITYKDVNKFIWSNRYDILKDSVGETLTEQQLINLSVGFQTDFNGWVNHSKPKYKTKRQKRKSGRETFNEFDEKGLAHPGLINLHWEELTKRGVDLTPLKRSSEKFLQLWQSAIDQKH